MGELGAEKSVLRPWLDQAEEDGKFVKGVIGETSDRWTAIPKLAPCWRGVEREWRIEEGRSYQSQCRCPYWKCGINPSGFTCEECRARMWPEIERLRAHVLPTRKSVEEQAKIVLDALAHRRLTEAEAITLGEEFDLPG